MLFASRLRVSDTAPARARAVHVVFALALTRRYEFGVNPRTVLVGHLQREFGAAVRGHPKAKAQPALKEDKRRIIELPDLDRGAVRAQIKRLYDLVSGRAKSDLDFGPRSRCARRLCRIGL